MSFSKRPFEMWDEFPLFSERSATRDFSRRRCSPGDMHLPAGLPAWAAGLEPVSCNNSLRLLVGSGTSAPSYVADVSFSHEHFRRGPLAEIQKWQRSPLVQ